MPSKRGQCLAVDCALHPTGASHHLNIANSVTAQLCKFPNRDLCPLLPAFDDTNVLPFDSQECHGVSKLLSQLFIVKLFEYVTLIINMVDPGLTKGTRLIRDASGVVAVMVKTSFSLAGRRVRKGAATYVNAVLSHGPESHGCLLMNCQVSPLSGWNYKNKELADVVELLQDPGFAGTAELIQSMGGRSSTVSPYSLLLLSLGDAIGSSSNFKGSAASSRPMNLFTVKDKYSMEYGMAINSV